MLYRTECCGKLQGSHSQVELRIGEETMKQIINKVFQILMDILIGIAIYFGISAFVPSANANLIIVITLIATAIFAEFVEMRIKK